MKKLRWPEIFPFARHAFKNLKLLFALNFSVALAINAADWRIDDDEPLALPQPGAYGLRILSPQLLELTLVTTKAPDPERVTQWDFIDAKFQFNTPGNSEFSVSAGPRKIPVQTIGFKRRPIYAPLKKRDLRIGNYLYLQLAEKISDGENVEVKNPSGHLWPSEKKFSARADPLRWSPAIHVNQEGYLPAFVKKAMVGFYLGSLGEMTVPPQTGFKLIEANSGKIVYEGQLVSRPDVGYTFTPLPYQQVLEADFTDFKKPGDFRVQVPGLGASFPFHIDEGIAADFARTYALGLFHQRCGGANELPFTRFVHEPCHVREAEVPTMSFEAVNEELAKMTGDFSANPRHTAPQLKNVNASLYPFVNTKKINVSGGHHDAGDYSKYTINVAQLIHALVFAADAFAGAGALDNLGLPESGDGKSDLLQEAKWEADFLAKLQDTDGGFYFLVYPRDRQYEHDVSLVWPDSGDPQIVYPKTTAATAAAVAALAQASSSPLFKKQFPEAAATYFEKAKKGWDFLQRAIAKNGRDGSYQKITHYGDESMHDDELAWAATEMFLATGDMAYEKELTAHFNPSDPNTKRWTWWRLFESYGCAIRSYAFAVRTGRLKTNQVDARFLAKCEDEIIAAAQEHVRFAQENAYGTSFPEPYKKFRNAGWYFSLDRAFDLATAYQIDFPIFNDPRPKFLEAIISNMNFEGGCNPVNMTYVTGIGWKRQREMVDHFAQNQRRSLPPSGLPISNIQDGFAYLDNYKKELGALTFPPDWDEKNPYPFYDRWGDSFNTTTEFVSVNLARGLGTTAFLMAQTSLKSQPWRAASAHLDGIGKKNSAQKKIVVRLVSPNLDLGAARCVWEASGQQPTILAADKEFIFVPAREGPQWIEAEALLPDGRRVFAVTNFVAGVVEK